MRQKDALANENAVLNKLVEKQQQKVEAANELQQSLTEQLVSAPTDSPERTGTDLLRMLQTSIEKELSLHQANVRAHQETISSLQRENSTYAAQREHDQRTIEQVN